MSAAAAATVGTIQTPSGPETVFSNVDDADGWHTCGNCGNTGARGGAALYTLTQAMSSPSEDGSSAEFALSPNAAYENGYWYIKHQLPSGEIKKLTYEFDLYVPSGSASAPQAIEFECQQKLNGWIYNFAWQANYVGGTWRIFDYVKRRWDDTGLRLTEFTPGQWHHLVAEYHANASAKKVFHDVLTVDGHRHQIGRVHDAKDDGSSGSDYFSNAFQLDSNNRGEAYNVFVDKMKVKVEQ
jgi:hypothetical protein